MDVSPVDTALPPTISNIQSQTSSEKAESNYGNVPEKWSSIGELLSSTKGTSQDSITVQPLLDSEFSGYESIEMNYTPLESPSATIEEKPSNQGTNNSDTNHIQADFAQNTASTANIEAVPPTTESPPETNSVAEKEDDTLELLAREMYNLLRQKLEVERERTGKYYSGRFPW
jgi:hypothetical protein